MVGVLMATNASHSIWGEGGDIVCIYSTDSGKMKMSVCVCVMGVCEGYSPFTLGIRTVPEPF